MEIPTMGHFLKAQLQVFAPVADPAVNVAGLVDFPIILHGLESIGQSAQVGIVLAGGTGDLVKRIVNAGFAAFNKLG